MKLIVAVVVCALAGCGHKASPPPSNVAEPTSAPDAAMAEPVEPSADSQCPAGQRYDECATSSCDGCEDCVGACVPQ